MPRDATNSIRPADVSGAVLESFEQPPERTRLKTILWTMFATLTLLTAAIGTGGYFYWQSLKSTPQYSLALLVDAARSDDQTAVDQLVDTDALVDDFIPQITSKAVELYGRGLSPKAIERAEHIAEPIMPAVKDRARAELPKVIGQKTDKFKNVPFAGMVIGADRYLDIQPDGNAAIITSKLPEHSFRVKMERHGDRWKIVGVQDTELAERIARSIGQELIAIASHGGINSSGERLGIKNVSELLKQVDRIFK